MTEGEKKNRTRLAIFLFALFFFSYGYFYQSGISNESSRYAHVRSLATYGTHDIGRYEIPSEDVVQIGDRTYSNKPPGSVYAALPAWMLAEKLIGLFSQINEITINYVCYLTCWWSVGLISAVLATTLAFVLARALQSHTIGAFFALLYGLCSLAFPFATSFFSHQITAACLWGGFAILFLLREQSESLLKRRLLSAVSGALCGYAICVEYPAAIPCIWIALYAVLILRKEVFPFIAGGILGAAPLLAFNLAVSGNPFFITYGVQGDAANPAFQNVSQGFFGAVWPSWKTFLELTFLPRRGLFFCNPWLFFILPALLFLGRKDKYQLEKLIAGAIIGSVLVFNASLVYWDAGWSIGPRYLLLILPFMTFLIALTFGRSKLAPVIYLTGLFSLGAMLMAAATEFRIPEYVSSPLAVITSDYLRARFNTFDLGPFGLTLVTAKSVAFNWGRLIGMPKNFEIAPITIFWSLMFFPILSAARSSDNTERFSLFGFQTFVPVCTIAFLLSLGFAAPVYSVFESHPDGLMSGLRASYGQGLSWKTEGSVPDRSAPLEREFLNQIEESPNQQWLQNRRKMPMQFSAEWNGVINVKEKGNYLFELLSYGGSAQYIDDKLLIDNWNAGKLASATASISLEPGPHAFTTRYFNLGGPGLIRIRWYQPGSYLKPLTGDVLFHD